MSLLSEKYMTRVRNQNNGFGCLISFLDSWPHIVFDCYCLILSLVLGYLMYAISLFFFYCGVPDQTCKTAGRLGYSCHECYAVQCACVKHASRLHDFFYCLFQSVHHMRGEAIIIPTNCLTSFHVPLLIKIDCSLLLLIRQFDRMFLNLNKYCVKIFQRGPCITDVDIRHSNKQEQRRSPARL